MGILGHINNLHLTIITAIDAVIQEFSVKFLLYMDGFYNHEEDIHAKISEDILTDTADEYKTMSQDIVDYYAITGTEISKVSDIIHLSLEDIEVYIDYKAVPSDWIETTPMQWK